MTKIEPGIHIKIGPKKGKDKSYPTVSITTGKVHRSSTGSTSASTYESPGSEASHTARTGYPDISPPPLNSAHGGSYPRPNPYRNPSSDESFPGSSRVAPVYHTSDDYDTPSLATGTTATSSGNRPIIHNGSRHVPSPINTTLGQSGSFASPYHTAEVTPRGLYSETSDRNERNHRTASSHAPEITGLDEDRQRRRDERRRQEAIDREVTASVMREENKRVRFETNRAKDRAEQRANKVFAGRAEGREHLRQKERKVREAQAAEGAAAKRSKPTTGTSKPAASPRSGSLGMSSAEAVKQQQLLDAEKSQMRKERIEAEAREREEQMQQQQYLPTLQQQQQDPRYYDPRRNSLSNSTRPNNLTRTNSNRQANPSTAAPRQDRRQPPVSYYNTARPDLLPARERRPSSSYGNPFAQPTPAARNDDVWDVRNLNQALPNAHGPQVRHNLTQPQQATHRMSQAFYTGDYETDSEDEFYGKR